jgi:cytochrome c peroxidase
MGSTQLGYTLNEREAEKITAFMHALTGEQPTVVHPVLPPSTPRDPEAVD